MTISTGRDMESLQWENDSTLIEVVHMHGDTYHTLKWDKGDDAAGNDLECVYAYDATGPDDAAAKFQELVAAEVS